ncbi:predicted protein [Naegleria gruberi]|uniref:Predicted protein n=1 Tax=Naegleria gruberi TaxID=5762 RepID=D2W210_NAEGR|nr:uncharacterized protein NAEGRDRAFT_75419 [Naegleria gruberi]EFC36907.1 predicted protein [Naegleria gruberi]|eukprot:XP_002669651.1 predicted protein [Naegleria gruberi strain NEG-M]
MGVSIPSVIQSNGMTNLYKFKTDPVTSSNLMVFVLPCEGKIDWFIANSSQVSKASELTTGNSLFSFIFPQIKYKSRSSKDDIPNVVTPFNLKGIYGILPGNSTYYLKVTNSGNVKARYNLLYSTSTNPYPILPSSDSITVKQNGDQIELSWNPVVENAAYIDYCVYAHSEQEHDDGDVHGSACAVFADSELQGCTSSTSFVLNLKKSAAYHIDVVATRKDNGRSWAYIGQEYVFKMNSAVGTFNMACLLLLATLQFVIVLC